MKEKNAGLYNILAITFLVLTACTCVVTLSWMGGIGVPGAIAPKTVVPVPTLRLEPTAFQFDASPAVPAADGTPEAPGIPPAEDAPTVEAPLPGAPPNMTSTPE